MATLTIPDQTLARLRAAAAARQISVEAYLDDVAAVAEGDSSSATRAQFRRSDVARRVEAADSIRELASEVKGKATIDELIADKHASHKHWHSSDLGVDLRSDR